MRTRIAALLTLVLALAAAATARASVPGLLGPQVACVQQEPPQEQTCAPARGFGGAAFLGFRASD